MIKVGSAISITVKTHIICPIRFNTKTQVYGGTHATAKIVGKSTDIAMVKEWAPKDVKAIQRS